jgi:hypothetical protein
VLAPRSLDAFVCRQAEPVAPHSLGKVAERVPRQLMMNRRIPVQVRVQDRAQIVSILLVLKPVW